jgi:hypothetical protein
VQSIALSARQKAGISSLAREKTGLPLTQKVTGQLISEQSNFIVILDGYLLSPSSDSISVQVIIVFIAVVVMLIVVGLVVLAMVARSLVARASSPARSRRRSIGEYLDIAYRSATSLPTRPLADSRGEFAGPSVLC